MEVIKQSNIKSFMSVHSRSCHSSELQVLIYQHKFERNRLLACFFKKLPEVFFFCSNFQSSKQMQELNAFDMF